MGYDPNVPATGHTGAQDYVPMQQNFAQIGTSFAVNHVPLNTSLSNGYHTLINFAAEQSSDPNLTAPLASLYTKAASGSPELFFQNGSMASNVIQVTGSILIESGNDGQTGTYNVFQTPWGIKIFTGQTKSFSGSLNCTFSGAQTFGSIIYTSQATPFGGGAIACSFTPSAGANTFNVMTAATIPLRWLAITN
jgi:hypothetical protein